MKSYHPSLDALEDRRLLSVSTPTDESALVASPMNMIASIVGRQLFYNNSRFDGNNPAINATDDTAIAVDKTALFAGQTATFANYTSSAAGINGIMIDVADLAGAPTLDDFVFRVGNNNLVANWTNAPVPASIAVRPGAGVGGSTRIEITWPDGSIRNQWLQVTVRATAATGLVNSDIFYFGNAVGDTGNLPINTLSNTADQLLVRKNPRTAANPAPVTSPYDFNRDGLVDSSDELISRTAYVGGSPMVRLISPGPFNWGQVVDHHIFYNNSVFDGQNAAADAADDAAIATDKSALLLGETASFANYTSYSRGINGVMIDVAGLMQTPSLSDFKFQIGNTDTSDNWTEASAPSSITVRWGAGVGGSHRITLVWPDGAITGNWLKVTLKATATTSLSNPDVFFFGNAVGETGDSTADAKVSVFDYLATQNWLSTTNLPATSPYDFNRDGSVSSADLSILASSFSNPTLQLIQPTQGALTASTNGEPAFVDLVSAAVVRRGVFYNNSQFDLSQKAANASDDNAIAPDKSALLPGQTASQANYTSYSRGLNGVFVDIAGAPHALTLDDFEFRVGNSIDPSTWALAPPPSQLLSRPGAGLNGSQRVMIVWQDNVIQNTWLQIRVKSTTNSGLKHDDVFYFGNLIGDSGTNPTLPVVNATDQIATRNQAYNFVSVAPITHIADFDRDTLVNSSDEWISARSQGSYLVNLIAPATATTLEPELPKDSFFHFGDSGVFVAFAPNLVKANDGTILYIGEARSGDVDESGYGVLIKRSFDNGATWTPLSMIYQEVSNSIRSPTVVVDKVTGEIFLLFTRNDSEILVTSSSDSGATWKTPVNITSSVKVTAQGNPNPAAFPSTPWGWYAVGSGHGIQLEHGAYAGRLMITADHRLTVDKEGPSWSHVIYSDDHGQTWRLGGGLSQIATNNNSNENVIVEQNDGTIYMNIRVVTASYRAFSRSYDGGATWNNMIYDGSLLTSSVNASILRVNANTLVFSAPDSTNDGRQRMTIWMSTNDGITWTKTKAVFYGYGSYSDMVLVGNDTVLLAFNSGRVNEEWRRYVTLVRFNLRWLTEPGIPQFTWQFAEKEPGERAELGNTSLLDDSIWDNRIAAVSSWLPEAPEYVAGPNGNTALRLTEGVDMITLSQKRQMSFQLERQESLTAEMTLRTTDSSGVIIGARPGIRGWSVRVVDGKVAFTVDDLNQSVTLTSNVTINDGNWHRVTVVRNGTSRLLQLVIDGVDYVSAWDVTTMSLANADPITMGAYNDGTQQLAFDIDVLRLTRKALASNEFMPSNLLEPARWPDPTFAVDAPNTINGLKFWLPSYQPAAFYADTKFGDYLAEHPTLGAVVQSGWDASDSKYRVVANYENRGVLYDEDAEVGANWRFDAQSSSDSHAMVVSRSNGLNTNNFDFVQNTGEFTLSTFVKLDQHLSNSTALFDTNNSSTMDPGFSLMVESDGSVRLLVSTGNGTARFNSSSVSGVISTDTWYHIAVVGQGVGQPVLYYITPVSSEMVLSQQSSVMGGVNSEFPTTAGQDLTIGSRTNGLAAFRGQMVDQAIYNRALTPTEIQQLFDYTKQSS